MFSANENIVLRQHKRRIIGFVEESLLCADELLDAGTTVLCMQVSCKDPGCVPLETVLTICFPSAQDIQQYVPLLEPFCRRQTRAGGIGTGTTFQTKVFLPMADITKDDILNVLPPEGFVGGRYSTRRIIHQARDVVLGYIEQQCSSSNANANQMKRDMALYLQQELQKYLDNDCVMMQEEDANDNDNNTNTNTNTNNTNENENDTTTGATSGVAATASTTATPPSTTTKPTMSGTGNLVIRRILDDNDNDKELKKQQDVTNSNRSTTTTTTTSTANDWRRYQQSNRQFSSAAVSSSASASASSLMNNGIQNLQRLESRQHASGIRQSGCPCCDPDNPSNYVDAMMML